MPSFTMSTRAVPQKSFLCSPRGAAQVPQDGIGLEEGEVSDLELGELPVQAGGLQ